MDSPLPHELKAPTTAPTRSNGRGVRLFPLVSGASGHWQGTQGQGRGQIDYWITGKQQPPEQVVPAGQATPALQVAWLGGQVGVGMSLQMVLRILRKLKLSCSGSPALKNLLAAGGGWACPPASAIMSRARTFEPTRKPTT